MRTPIPFLDLCTKLFENRLDRDTILIVAIYVRDNVDKYDQVRAATLMAAINGYLDSIDYYEESLTDGFTFGFSGEDQKPEA
jgi:hypothetical protein